MRKSKRKKGKKMKPFSKKQRRVNLVYVSSEDKKTNYPGVYHVGDESNLYFD